MPNISSRGSPSSFPWDSKGDILFKKRMSPLFALPCGLAGENSAALRALLIHLTSANRVVRTTRLPADECPFDMTPDLIDIPDDDYGVWYVDAMDHPDRWDGKKVHMKLIMCHSKKFPGIHCR